MWKQCAVSTSCLINAQKHSPNLPYFKRVGSPVAALPTWWTSLSGSLYILVEWKQGAVSTSCLNKCPWMNVLRHQKASENKWWTPIILGKVSKQKGQINNNHIKEFFIHLHWPPPPPHPCPYRKFILFCILLIIFRFLYHCYI